METLTKFGSTVNVIDSFVSSAFMKLGLGLMVLGFILIAAGKYYDYTTKDVDPKTNEKKKSYKTIFGIITFIIGLIVYFFNYIKYHTTEFISKNKSLAAVKGLDTAAKLFS